MEDFYILSGSDEELEANLTLYPSIQTITLSWYSGKVQSTKYEVKSRQNWTSLKDISNLAIQKYYTWSGSENLCKAIKLPGGTKMRYDVIYNQQCDTNINKTSNVKSLEAIYFWAMPAVRYDPKRKALYYPKDIAFPSYYYTSLPKHIFHMYITENVVVTDIGDIFTKTLKPVTLSCNYQVPSISFNSKPPQNYKTVPIYDEVFIISQHWGDQYYHKMLEAFPRIMPYLTFLKDNPLIWIHAKEVSGHTAFFMEYVGLNQTRLIHGHVRAKVIYSEK